MEAAIIDQARRHSDWWQKNRERLCFNHEGSLCYLAILALKNSPQPNIDLIGRLLCKRNLLEFGLTYELCALLKAAFIYLDSSTQEKTMEIMQTIGEEPAKDERARFWKLSKRAEFISAIPCYLRSPEAQAIIEAYEKMNGVFVRQPSINWRSGMVASPFSFEIFINVSESAVIRLLAHYAGYCRNSDDVGIGGEDSVGWELHEASSRYPSRFLKLLRTYWTNISASFRNDILEGIAKHLMHRYGNLQTNGNWVPIEEPDPSALTNQILDELERHSAHWWHNSSSAKALEACAHVVQDTENAERLVFSAIGFGNLWEESSDSGNLLTAGINMTIGHVAEALMVLANRFHERGIALPELLPPALCLFACNENPAIRALILEYLPYLQSMNPELGWKLYYLAMKDAVGLWHYAEKCLYYAYHDHFERVIPELKRIYADGNNQDLET
jgi:hypothetical protein